MTNSRLVDPEHLRVLFEQIIPFNRHMGIRVLEVREGFAALEIPFRPELVGNPLVKALHGGVVSALLDSCGGIAVWSQLGPSDLVATVDLRVDYLRPARPENLVGQGRVVRLGNRVGVVELRAYQAGSGEDPVAAGTGVYNVRRSAHPIGGDLWQELRGRSASG